MVNLLNRVSAEWGSEGCVATCVATATRSVAPSICLSRRFAGR